MKDDLDVDDLLEAPINEKLGLSKNGKSSRSRTPSRRSRETRSRSRNRRRRSRDRSGDRRRRSRSRSRTRDRDRRRSRSRDRRRSGSNDRWRRTRSRSRSRRRSRSRSRRSRSRSRRSGSAGRRSPSRERSPKLFLTPEERDARTVLVMQLSQRCRARDIEEFFSAVGKIQDVRLIMCNKTRRFKGIAYIEFRELESVTLALGLNGQKLLGIPVIVQPSQAEKNRTNDATDRLVHSGDKGPMRLYVGSLHVNITEEMLRGIFEPFGRIQSLSLTRDQATGISKGYGFVTFYEAEDAKQAMEQMNGLDIAGKPIKVSTVTDTSATTAGSLELEEFDRAGIDLGATGRLALMAKLAAGTGLKLPEMATQALNQTTMLNGGQAPSVASVAAAAHSALQQQQLQQQLPTGDIPIITQCFLLSNMFDPAAETSPDWDQEIRDDVIDECSRHGGVLHIYVDKFAPEGNVYVKCDSSTSAVASVNALHGRWFAGKVIRAAYIPVVNYHSLFPDSATASTPLPARQ